MVACGFTLGRAALNEYLNKCLHNMDVHMYSRYRTRFAYKTCEKTGHVEEVESTQGDRHGAPGCICLCLYTSISSTLGSKSWALAQTIQQPAISPWPMHHHLHTDTSTSLHLISVHSLTRSLACLVCLVLLCSSIYS